MASTEPQFCPDMLARGTCEDPLCEYTHALHTCDACSFMCATAEEYEEHVRTRWHYKKTNPTKFLRCPVCKKFMNGFAPWNDHARAAGHHNACLAQGIDPEDVEPEEITEVPQHTFCVPCNIQVLNRFWPAHERGFRHRQKQQYAIFKTTLEDAEKDKNGITVTGNLEFGIIEISDASTGRLFKEASITATSPTSRISLVDVQLTSVKGSTPGHHPFRVVATGLRRVISTRSPASIKVYLLQDYAGRCQDRVELIFEDNLLRKSFTIARPLFAIIGDRADYERLRPIAPYVPPPKTARLPETTIIEGERPPAMGAVPYVVPLPQADIPKRLAGVLSKGTVGTIITQIRTVFLPSEFNSQTYSRHFKYLAWIEEYRAEQDLSIYDMSEVKLDRHNKYYLLDVPGLAEKRPSVLIGDRILVQPEGSPSGLWFEGRVHFVRQKEVGLVFHRSFTGWSPSRRYSVRFKLNRYPIRRQHLAMDSAWAEDRVLFPAPYHLSFNTYSRPSPHRARVYNTLIGTNPPQLQAVASIMELPPGSPPFIIFGPPGTGKTVTAVEAILQVVRRHPNSRVLACAPSNSAADILALRLRELGTDMVFRFYAPSRNKDDVPLELRDFTYMRSGSYNEAPCFTVPTMARMRRFRVVVTTCISASFASGIGLPRGHFSHIFVDEAGQASEPEVMIGIKTMADSDTNVILSGDPKQLGPIIRSPVARQLGLEKSYLERLMERPAYDVRRNHGISIVKLTRNFRSHGAILKFPNERFYASELEQCADKKLTDYYLDSSYLPNKNFPVVFHGICGKDDREASSPSFFNIDEIIQVKRYVQSLRYERRFRTTDSDIGIISPYNAQCRKIRTALRGIADDVKVGSVEEFQGQERKVIIISTVRSSTEFIEYDLKHTLGFVASPRRFNVAITRAQALLIVVGDPNVLSLDPLWRSFLNHIHRNGGWTGTPITWDPYAPVDSAGGYDRRVRAAAEIDMNEFTRRMETLTLETVEANEADNNVDRPWRDVE